MSAHKATAPTVSDLRQPLWLEIAVPVPGTDQRVILWTGPWTVDGVSQAMAALSPQLNPARLDAMVRDVEVHRKPKTRK